MRGYPSRKVGREKVPLWVSGSGSVARSMSRGAAVIDPLAIMGVSSILATLLGMFWKNVEKQFKLS